MPTSPTSTPTPRVRVIAPRKRLELIDLGELWEYRDLFYFMVRREIRSRYAQTVLGFGWAIVRPTVTMLLMSVVFGGLAKIQSDGVPYPLFSFAALLPWTFFSSATSTAAGSLVGNSMISKVYFPRLIVPMTPVLSNLVDFAIASVIMAVLMIYYGTVPTAGIVVLPLLILLMVLTATGIGMWFSALAVQFRDLKYAMTFVVQLMMYAAPVVWAASAIPEKYRLLYGLYPMAGVIEGFRSALLGTNPMPLDLLASGTASALVIFISGAMYFRHREHLFADVA